MRLNQRGSHVDRWRPYGFQSARDNSRNSRLDIRHWRRRSWSLGLPASLATWETALPTAAGNFISLTTLVSSRSCETCLSLEGLPDELVPILFESTVVDGHLCFMLRSSQFLVECVILGRRNTSATCVTPCRARDRRTGIRRRSCSFRQTLESWRGANGI